MWAPGGFRTRNGRHNHTTACILAKAKSIKQPLKVFQQQGSVSRLSFYESCSEFYQTIFCLEARTRVERFHAISALPAARPQMLHAGKPTLFCPRTSQPKPRINNNYNTEEKLHDLWTRYLLSFDAMKRFCGWLQRNDAPGSLLVRSFSTKGLASKGVDMFTLGSYF